MPRPSSLPSGNSSHAFWSALQAAWTFHATGNSGAGCDPVKGGSIGTLTTATRSDTTGLNDTTANGKCQLASTLTVGNGPYSLMWRSKNTTTNDGMVFGAGVAAGYMWMSEGANTVRFNDGANNVSLTLADAKKTVLYDYCITAGTPSGTNTIKLYWKLSTDTTWTLAGSQVVTPQSFSINNFGDGYGGALGFIGELHYFMQFNSELSQANLNASFSDPYDILSASNSITLTAQSASTKVKLKKASGTYSFTLAGTYLGSGAIEYKWGASGAWTTLVASPTGGTYSQVVNVDGTTAAQGFSVRLASFTSVTASDPLVTIADEVYVLDCDSISAGRLTNDQVHTGRTYTSLKYDTSNGWTEADDKFELGGSKGSHWPLLSNYLADDRIVCFIPHGTSGALMSNFSISAIQALVSASGLSTITGVLMHGGANDIAGAHANTNSASAWSTLCQTIGTAVATAYSGAFVRYAILGDVSSITGQGARATAVRQGALAAIAAAPTTCKLGSNVWWRTLATDHLHPTIDAEGTDYAQEWWQVLRTGTSAAPTYVSSAHNAGKTIVTVTFDQAIRTGTTLTPACFEVADNGTPVAISTAVASGSTVVLTLASAASGTLTVSMAKALNSFGTPPQQATSVTLPNSGGNFYPAAMPFFDQAVTAPDTTPPVIASKTINTAGTICTLVFTDSTLPILPVGGITGFTLSSTGGTLTILSASRTASDTVVLALSRRVLSTETVTLSYSSGNVTDSAAALNALATISNSAVTNNSTQTSSSGGVVLTRTFSPVASW